MTVDLNDADIELIFLEEDEPSLECIFTVCYDESEVSESDSDSEVLPHHQ